MRRQKGNNLDDRRRDIEDRTPEILRTLPLPVSFRELTMSSNALLRRITESESG